MNPDTTTLRPTRRTWWKKVGYAQLVTFGVLVLGIVVAAYFGASLSLWSSIVFLFLVFESAIIIEALPLWRYRLDVSPDGLRLRQRMVDRSVQWATLKAAWFHSAKEESYLVLVTPETEIQVTVDLVDPDEFWNAVRPHLPVEALRAAEGGPAGSGSYWVDRRASRLSEMEFPLTVNHSGARVLLLLGGLMFGIFLFVMPSDESWILRVIFAVFGLLSGYVGLAVPRLTITADSLTVRSTFGRWRVPWRDVVAFDRGRTGLDLVFDTSEARLVVMSPMFSGGRAAVQATEALTLLLEEYGIDTHSTQKPAWPRDRNTRALRISRSEP